MHPTDERGGDYSRYLAVQELFRELTPLLSLMCIPLCFSVQPFYFMFPVSFGFMGALILQQRSEGYRSILSIRYVALPSKLGVSLQR
ncbi:hypothetical protein R6Z07F_002526 [Ovis aries]